MEKLKWCYAAEIQNDLAGLAKASFSALANKFGRFQFKQKWRGQISWKSLEKKGFILMDTLKSYILKA